MTRRNVSRAILFYLVPVTCGIVFTLLAELLIGYMTNVFALYSPALVAICEIAGAVLLCALVLFVCAMYVIVLMGALMELKARKRLYAIGLAHRKIELDRHKLQRSGRRITVALNPDAVSRQHVTHHEQGC